jgi:hypothetical protein
LSSEIEHFDLLNPSWFLQWAVDRTIEENPGKDILVVNEQGDHLFTAKGEGNTGFVTLETDSKNLHCRIHEG